MNISKVIVKIEKDFTVIPNEIIRNKEMSMNSKMLLITMLSLPPGWDFSINGLKTIVKEGRDTVRNALQEIEKYGYLTRNRVRNADGTLLGYEYTVYQYPVEERKRTYKNKSVKPKTEKPTTVKPFSDEPTMDFPIQYSKDIELSKDILLSKDDKISKEIISPTELNSFSKEKAPSPVGLNSSISKRNKKGGTETDKWIATKTHIEVCMERYDYEKDSLETIEVVEIVKAYYEKYKEMAGKPHPRLNDKVMMFVVGQCLKEVCGEVLDVQAYRDLIDFHFKTEYREGTDWTIQHFMSGDIRETLLRHNML